VSAPELIVLGVAAWFALAALTGLVLGRLTHGAKRRRWQR